MCLTASDGVSNELRCPPNSSWPRRDVGNEVDRIETRSDSEFGGNEDQTWRSDAAADDL